VPRRNCSGVRFLTGACVVAELKDDPALGKFDAAVDSIKKLHDKGGCFSRVCSLSFYLLLPSC
jgi:hypothetical protein